MIPQKALPKSIVVRSATRQRKKGKENSSDPTVRRDAKVANVMHKSTTPTVVR